MTTNDGAFADRAPDTVVRPMGCCVDKSCTADTCMRLPEGKTCGDCVHIGKCAQIFGHVPGDIYCDWFPRKFDERLQDDSRD